MVLFAEQANFLLWKCGFWIPRVNKHAHNYLAGSDVWEWLSNMAEDDEIVLNFNDSLLRKSDVDLLGGPCWINDNLIGFTFE